MPPLPPLLDTVYVKEAPEGVLGAVQLSVAVPPMLVTATEVGEVMLLAVLVGETVDELALR
jgi:hypothetical protein